MKVGDKVYIICYDKRTWENDKTCTISKVGKMYFEVDEVGPWYRFHVNPNNEHYGNWSMWAKGNMKGERSNDFQWYPSEEYYLKIQENTHRRWFVRENISLLTNEEIFEIYHKIKGRKGE